MSSSDHKVGWTAQSRKCTCASTPANAKPRSTARTLKPSSAALTRTDSSAQRSSAGGCGCAVVHGSAAVLAPTETLPVSVSSTPLLLFVLLSAVLQLACVAELPARVYVVAAAPPQYVRFGALRFICSTVTHGRDDGICVPGPGGGGGGGLGDGGFGGGHRPPDICEPGECVRVVEAQSVQL